MRLKCVCGAFEVRLRSVSDAFEVRLTIVRIAFCTNTSTSLGVAPWYHWDEILDVLLFERTQKLGETVRFPANTAFADCIHIVCVHFVKC